MKQPGYDLPSGSQAEQGESLTDFAMCYVRIVKDTFEDEKEKYVMFLRVWNEYNHKRIGPTDLIARVKELIKEYEHLVRGFNTFLPEEYKTKLEDDIASSKIGAILSSLFDERSGSADEYWKFYYLLKFEIDLCKAARLYNNCNRNAAHSVLCETIERRLCSGALLVLLTLLDEWSAPNRCLTMGRSAKALLEHAVIRTFEEHRDLLVEFHRWLEICKCAPITPATTSSSDEST